MIDIVANKGLVYKAAAYIRARNSHSLINEIWEDLIQEGMVALCDAGLSYDPKRGKFSTYAYIIVLRRMILMVKNERNSVVRSKEDLAPRDAVVDQEVSFGILETLTFPYKEVLTGLASRESIDSICGRLPFTRNQVKAIIKEGREYVKDGVLSR